MGRQPRSDAPGQWHHVMNRAVGRRAMFESASDVRRFLDRLAKTVEQGWLEVHAYVVMQTHFHLLLLSLVGCLSRALHYLQAPYARWFNWSRERDGPLHRGRFLSKPVDSLRYRRLLVRYIDQNPVVAGLAATPSLYPHGSASDYAREAGPSWLTRAWVEQEVAVRAGTEAYRPSDYSAVFGERLTPEHAQFLELDASRRDGGELPVDHLLVLAKEGMADWLRERAAHADGTRALRPIVAPASILRAVDASGLLTRPTSGRGRSLRSPRNLAAALLLRTLAGHGMAELGADLRCQKDTAAKICGKAREQLAADPDFATQVADLAASIVQQFWSRV